MSAGVDFGTYRSVVARVQNGRPRELPLGAVQGEWDVPSLVFLPSEGGEPLFGNAAQIRAASLAARPDSGLTITNLKLELMNASKTWGISSNNYTVDDLFFGLTKHLLELCRDRSPDFESEGSCFTLPCFVSLARQTQLAVLLRQAGWARPTFLQEPAAALCGALQNQPLESGTYLVIDVGHGSCDLGVVEIEHAPGSLAIRELFFVGNTWVSGEEIDRAFLTGLTQNFQEFVPTDRSKFARIRSQLQTELRKVKESLSFQETADLIVPHFPNAARYLDLEVRRGDFENYLDAAGLLECLTNLVTFARKQSDFEGKSLNMILTGRSSLLPVVRRMLETEFPDCPMVPPFKRPEDAKLVVAHGAALHAAGFVGIRYQQAVRREIHVAGMAQNSALVRIGEPLPLTRNSTLEVRGGGRDIVLLERAPGEDLTELLRQPLPQAIRQATSDLIFEVELTLDVTEEGCKMSLQLIRERKGDSCYG